MYKLCWTFFQDLYHKYMWNNFLHTQVEQCIGTVLSNVQTEGEGQQPETPLVQQVRPLSSKFINIGEVVDFL